MKMITIQTVGFKIYTNMYILNRTILIRVRLVPCPSLIYLYPHASLREPRTKNHDQKIWIGIVDHYQFSALSSIIFFFECAVHCINRVLYYQCYFTHPSQCCLTGPVAQQYPCSFFRTPCVNCRIYLLDMLRTHRAMKNTLLFYSQSKIIAWPFLLDTIMSLWILT